MNLLEKLTTGSGPAVVREDQRGTAVFYPTFSVKNLHVVTMNPGASRGNHSHDQDEVICVLGGEHICEITVTEATGSNRRETAVAQLPLESFRIRGGLRHTVRNTGDHVFYLVCFLLGESTGEVSRTED
jgi:oxalate decarboxylase/phosphoglucose isomerase-like protein (cupin superfamily)